MKVIDKETQKIHDVYALAIYHNNSDDENVVLYIDEEENIGLGALNLVDSKVLDESIGVDFKFIFDKDLNVSFILWNHFKDIFHLSQLIELEPETLRNFEKAKKLKKIDMQKIKNEFKFI